MPDLAPAGGAALSVEQRLAVQYSIARAFAEAERLEEVSGFVLKTLADALGWQTASLWILDEDGRNLRCAATYSSSPKLAAWIEETRNRRLPIGVGIPGRVWASQQPAWISDTNLDENFPRRAVAQQSGLRRAFAIPVRVRGAVGAVVEFFAPEVGDVDSTQTGFLEAVGHQLGSFIERVEARRDVAFSEARKTGVLSAAVDAIVSADRNGRILEFNPAAERLFGRRRDEAIGRRVAELLVPEDLRATHEHGLRRYIETGQPRILGERVRTWALRADGSLVAAELTVTEIRVDGQPMFTAFIRDITAEREAETARDRFLEILSHELRTPVTAIYGGAKMLARPSIDGATRVELVSDIGAEADRLYRLVEDLIVLARAERGAQPVSTEPVRLDHVARRVVALFAGQVRNLDLTLTETGTPVAVRGDETYVEQLLRNLLSNAVKYGAGGGVVEIEIVNGQCESEVHVLDRGPGIDPREAGRLFDMDYRSPLTKGLAQGSGIGLFVARWLAEGMGGRVWALPRDGGGSEFGFALPAVDSEAAEVGVLNLG